MDGYLIKEIIPEESYWTFEKNVCMLALKKMNLELLNNEFFQRFFLETKVCTGCSVDIASITWWSHLFGGHEELQWDDYDKDLSDLPERLREKLTY